MPNTPAHPVILFDGVCNLCNAAIQWIIRHDPAGVFHFASLQSQNVHPLESIVLIENQREYRRSTAFLRILHRLPKYRWLASIGAVIPPPIRDWVYDSIAQRRYHWFGKTDACMVPTPDLAARFIDPPVEA